MKQKIKEKKLVNRLLALSTIRMDTMYNKYAALLNFYAIIAI